MKVVQLNTFCGNGSTGKICLEISELLTKRGIENYIFYNIGYSDYSLGKQYMFPFEVKIQALKARILGNFGFNSERATRALIRELEEIAPEIVHLHNLHGHNVHLGMLFSYLKEKRVKIFWTFHDCWAFTGYCPHYDMIGCNQWKTTGCEKCPQKRRTSWFFDRSRYLFKKKQELFLGLDMTIITPSQWLADQVKQSFLSQYDVKIINNGINLSVFYPRDSDFRKRHQVEGKFIVLGVAHIWCKQKGLDVFIELSKQLDDRFRIVLVGTDEAIDKNLPDNIISIHRTENQSELAEIYAAADVFVNPTREEVLGLTNIEALACGTPVITFNTGGSVECIDGSCGFVVEKNDIAEMKEKIITVCNSESYSKLSCVKRAEKYRAEDKFEEYMELYCRQ